MLGVHVHDDVFVAVVFEVVLTEVNVTAATTEINAGVKQGSKVS